ncbi:MAG: type II secretion system F family protein [Eubacteriales bacterium]|nr:type II secretion system F family protein [Eubacteriales bacterium]
MSTFRYEAMSKDGASVKGVIKARDVNEASIQLNDEMAYVQSLKEVYDYEGLFDRLNQTGGKISNKSLSLVCQQFSIMLGAGLPVGYAVGLVERQTADKTIKKILKEVEEDVAAGYRLADSFQIHGEKLPVTFIETVRSGEESGSLAEAFKRMSDFYMTRHKLYSKIKGAMTYPAFVILLAIVVVAIVMIFAIPTIANTFVSQGQDLPGITVLLINMSNFFRHWFWLIALVGIVIVLAVMAYSKTEEGGMNISKLILKLPMFGKIERLNIASQFCSTMSTMLIAGLPLIRALTITGKTISNKYVSGTIENAVKNLESGFTLGESLKHENSLDPLLIEMCTMGEQSGSLDDTLTAIGKYYDYETETAAQAALAKLEPGILVFLGIFVGFIVIALYLPMFTMYNGM